jgi:F-box protein 21
MSRHLERSSLVGLPDEILQHILYFIPPDDALLRCQLVSKRLYLLTSQSLLWRYHCRFEFSYWDARHRIRQKFFGEVGDVDWKSLYIYRRKVEQTVTKVLDSIIESQTGRIAKYKGISVHGYDAKDALIRHCNTQDSVEDVLARRYYRYCHLRNMCLTQSQILCQFGSGPHTSIRGSSRVAETPARRAGTS